VYWGAPAPVGSNMDTPSEFNHAQRLWIAATLARGVLR
jgi:hypothetical protein